MFFITEEEISAMRKELDKYGIQMPAFSKIGGILANEVCLLFSLFNHSVKKNTPYSTLNHCCQVKLGISYAEIIYYWRAYISISSTSTSFVNG